jgi:Flp pilus assembly pilin Flp
MTRLRTEERGAGLVEYALIVGLIAIVSVVAVSLVGTATSDSFTESQAAFGPAVEYPTKVVEVKDQIKITFSDIDGKLDMTDAYGPGWTMKITKQNNTRINTKWTNDVTGDVVRVNGWINKKGDIKTRIR